MSSEATHLSNAFEAVFLCLNLKSEVFARCLRQIVAKPKFSTMAGGKIVTCAAILLLITPVL